MVYCGTDIIESIVVHPAGNSEDKHVIGLVKHADDPVFSVECCCNSEWRYEFYMNGNADYERVKFNIMESIFECENMDELLAELSEVFEDGLADILIRNEDEHKCNCDGSCEDCHCKS